MIIIKSHDKLSDRTLEFKLFRYRMIERGIRPYFLHRKELRRAIEQKESAVAYEIGTTHYRTYFAYLEIERRASRVIRIEIGCQKFTGENARKLYSWAIAK